MENTNMASSYLDTHEEYLCLHCRFFRKTEAFSWVSNTIGRCVANMTGTKEEMLTDVNDIACDDFVLEGIFKRREE